MMRFVENPNLPMGEVSCVICGELCDQLNAYLDSEGIERIVIEPNLHIDPAVRFHADMSVIHLGGKRLLIDKNQHCLIEQLKIKGFDVSESAKEIAGEYPNDIPLNFTVIGDKIIGNFKYADSKLLSLFSQDQRVDVNQGYCKCSCLVVDDNSLITDDKTIFDRATACGLDCLLISKGDIYLKGHNYGFIGGSSCKISKEKILFFGDITKHTDYKKIADFIVKHGCKIVSLDFPLSDFGGIIPITDKAP